MKQKVIRINEDQIRKVVEESLRSALGSMFSKEGRAERKQQRTAEKQRREEEEKRQNKEFGQKVISVFENFCKECGLEIQFTLSGIYFGAVADNSVSDSAFNQLSKLIRNSWIKEYIQYDKIQRGDTKSGIRYYINFDDGGYLSDRYHQQMMYDLEHMKSGWAEKYKIPIRFKDEDKNN